MAGRTIIASAVVLILLALSACSDVGPGRPPSYRHLEQNAPSSSDFTPRNSLPP